jgi:hypothetical protein
MYGCFQTGGEGSVSIGVLWGSQRFTVVAKMYVLIYKPLDGHSDEYSINAMMSESAGKADASESTMVNSGYMTTSAAGAKTQHQRASQIHIKFIAFVVHWQSLVTYSTDIPYRLTRQLGLIMATTIICAICNTVPAKYTCPHCSVR